METIERLTRFLEKQIGTEYEPSAAVEFIALIIRCRMYNCMRAEVERLESDPNDMTVPADGSETKLSAYF